MTWAIMRNLFSIIAIAGAALFACTSTMTSERSRAGASADTTDAASADTAEAAPPADAAPDCPNGTQKLTRLATYCASAFYFSNPTGTSISQLLELDGSPTGIALCSGNYQCVKTISGGAAPVCTQYQANATVLDDPTSPICDSHGQEPVVVSGYWSLGNVSLTAA